MNLRIFKSIVEWMKLFIYIEMAGWDWGQIGIVTYLYSQLLC